MIPVRVQVSPGRSSNVPGSAVHGLERLYYIVENNSYCSPVCFESSCRDDSGRRRHNKLILIDPRRVYFQSAIEVKFDLI